MKSDKRFATQIYFSGGSLDLNVVHTCFFLNNKYIDVLQNGISVLIKRIIETRHSIKENHL